MTRESLLDPTTTSTNDWHYVSEGGATIVFSYCGPQHRDFTGTVLRLRKTNPENLLADGTNSTNDDDDDNTEDPSVEFQNKIVSRLLPASCLPRLETVVVGAEWLNALQIASACVRPSERRDVLDVRRRRAVLATDLVGGTPLTVEIKPKWGFMPNPTHLSADTREIKTQRCRFCLHSRYRLSMGKVSAYGYCPLDLYSGDEKRILRALKDLLKSWVESSGNINNFRVFVNGKTTNPAEFKWKTSDGPVLERLGCSSQAPAQMEEFASLLLPIVSKTPVFENLSHLQRTLDPLDTEGLFSLYETYRNNSPDLDSVPPFEELFPDPSIQDWENFLNEYLSPEFQAALDHAHPKSEQLHYYTMAYLLSASFKDCSVIIGIEGGSANVAPVTVIDLDPKSMNRLKKWADSDRMFAISFKDDGSRRCLDAARPKSHTVPYSCHQEINTRKS